MTESPSTVHGILTVSPQSSMGEKNHLEALQQQPDRFISLLNQISLSHKLSYQET